MKLLTLDIETDVKTQEVVVITTRGPDGAINLWTPDNPEAFRYIKDVMADQDVMLVGHNIAFDCAALQFLSLWNILLWDFYDAGRVTDTMIREKLRNLSVGRLDTFDYGLDNLAEKYFGISIAKDKDDPTSWRMRFGELKNTAFEQWPADALAYCRQDVEITYALWNAQTKKDGAALDLVRPDGKITNETEQVRAALALRLMSIGGIAVDPVKTEQLEKDWTAQIAEGRAKADKYYKRKEIKRGPNPRVEITKNMTLLREDVAKELGELCPRTEPSKLHPLGCAKTDSETLELCESPAIRALAEMSGAEKLLTAFLPVLKQGVVYPSYDILKATGRTSCFGPNIQQLPRKGGVRECLVAREGNCFIECLPPSTRLLTTDLRWVPIGDIQAGDELVGFDETLGFRDSKFRASVALRNERVIKHCYKITTSRGVITASENHSWVARRDFAAGYRGVRKWITTKDLKAGDSISFFCEPWEFDSSYEGGWLSGMFDGEGWVSGGEKGSFRKTGIGIAQNDGAVFERLKKDFAARELPFHISRAKRGTCNRIQFTGEKSILRVLGMFRPQRLLANAGRGCWENKSTWGKRSQPAVVLSVEDVGEQEVCALSTSTKTFVAEGFLSHNCDYASIELCSLAQVHLNLFGKSTMADAINSGKDLHLVTAARILNRPYETLDKKDPAVKDARQLSKAANFGYPGGMGPEKFCLYAKASYGLNISLAQSAKLRQAWMQAYPEMKLYFDYVSDMTRSPWELVQHVSGRIRGGCGFCDGANSLFQGLAADGAKAGLYLVAREAYRLDSNSPLRGAFGGAFIHDEQILEISLDKAPAAGVRLGELMVRGMKAYIPDVLVKAEPLLMEKWYKEAEAVLDANGKLIPWEPKK